MATHLVIGTAGKPNHKFNFKQLQWHQTTVAFWDLL